MACRTRWIGIAVIPFAIVSLLSTVRSLPAQGCEPIRFTTPLVQTERALALLRESGRERFRPSVARPEYLSRNDTNSRKLRDGVIYRFGT